MATTDELTVRALELARSGNIDEALPVAEQALAAHPDCPYLLVLRARLIQLYDGPLSVDLRAAEDSLLKAYEIDRGFVPALYDLAHFYHAVAPDVTRAKHFAALCAMRLKTLTESIDEILHNHDDPPSQ